MFLLEKPPERAWTRAHLLARALHKIGLSDDTIATIINCDGRTVNRIRHGRQSGRNLLPRLENLYELMRECYGRD